jgi:Domain of unknown function (DUF4338)
LHGYLGGLAFSAAAWRLAPRDQWLGWSDVARAENLHRVVNQSRFLIRAHLLVPNLASHSLPTRNLWPGGPRRHP